MAHTTLYAPEGNQESLRAVIDGLNEDLGPMPWESLCEAVRRDDIDTVREGGLELVDITTVPPKREAILVGRINMLELLLQRDNYVDEGLVKVACDRKDQLSLRMLFDFGWPINHPVEGVSVLCYAIDDLAFTQWLVDNGADVNLRSRNGETAVSLAIAFGSIDVVTFLLNRGIDYSHGDLVHCAAQREDEQEGASLIKYFAQKGLDMNTHRYDNSLAFRWRVFFKYGTPLHVACEERRVLVARTLLECGADPHRKMLEAQKLVPPTPYEVAMESMDEDLRRLFTALEESDRGHA